MKKACLNKAQRAKKITPPPSPSLKGRGRGGGWKRCFRLKKIVLTGVIFFAMVMVVFSQEKTDVNLRSGRINEAVRLVFEAEEAFLKKTNVSTSGMQINVEFPSAFNVKTQKDINLETSAKDRILTINLKEPFEIKILRLSSPPRLVIDIFLSMPKGAADQKPQPEVVLSHKVFIIDPGHGGYDFGITGSDMKEKDIALSVARETESLLTKKGRSVFLTRKSDQSLSLKDRAIFANQKMPEVFVSIHVSASEKFALYISKISDSGSEPSAAEMYGLSFRQKKYVQKSRKLAEALGKALKEEFNLDIVQREMSLPVLNSAGAPGVLIEIPSFKIMNYDQKTRTRLAEAIIKGFSYYGQ